VCYDRLIHKNLKPHERSTVVTYVTAVKGFLAYEGISLDSYKLRAKVELPANVEVSMDRIPTREELRMILLN
jgi:hypothetical protein